ncbi:dTDP-4-dehydrorhamnose reductase [Shouchella lehensis]|uniref:dTDP-4-dehydrorhamnose reductase n=1 Tax=Shouchella lehensis G1 TaxID=1246626 RepID=A0A060LXY1_9BACI|nr:dTDP-4-dehydrorhamnose reductase [Shouchella lehensis]AIC96091.1 Spore coat polysaccharide biosynthesis protein spsK [Shouchella lehensis G1]
MYRTVLITGAGGQLGHDLVNIFSQANYQVHGLTREELDITNQDNVKSVFKEINPDIVLHSAAYTAVDKAEDDVDSAYLVNAIGTRNIAIESNKYDAKVVYVSTDYVFDGTAVEPIHEFHDVSPIGVYGRSKLAGENYIRDLCNKFFIVRTSWVYGKNGNNFVKTMLDLSKRVENIDVVYDQIGCPTNTLDLAEKILELTDTNKFGIYHISNTGSCSWYEFAQTIFKITNNTVKVNPVSSDQFIRKAKRPKYSVLDHMSLRINGFKPMNNWESSLEKFLQS